MLDFSTFAFKLYFYLKITDAYSQPHLHLNLAFNLGAEELFKVSKMSPSKR